MCMEPECLVPLVSFKSTGQVVLIGDHKQLQPIVVNNIAKNLGLEKSLFERYKDRALMLTEQYRMVSVQMMYLIFYSSTFSADQSRVATRPAFGGTSRFLALVSRVPSPTSARRQLSRFLVAPCRSCLSLPLHHSRPIEFSTKSTLAHTEFINMHALHRSYNVLRRDSMVCWSGC